MGALVLTGEVFAAVVSYLFVGAVLASRWRLAHGPTSDTSVSYDFWVRVGVIGVAIGWPVAFGIVYPLIWLAHLAVWIGNYQRPRIAASQERIAELEDELLP